MSIAYRPEIDGLRAVAVLAVVLFHAGIGSAGFVGVDVFFVISGYLITRILAAREIDFMAFYARRARRILPALVVVVAVTLALSVFILTDPSDVSKSAVAAAGFVANVYFQADDYWTAHTRPLLHLWSLSVEEQFYLVWPVLMLLARRRIVVVLCCLAVASLGLAEFLDPRIAFYTMPARAWELAVGALLALVPLKVPRITSAIGLAVTIFACILPMPSFPGVGAIPAVLGAALVIAGGQNRLLASKPMVSVGLISYSLYLWHWPLIVLGREVGFSPLLMAALAFPLAALSYRYVETPFRHIRTSDRKAVAVGVACIAVIACTAWATPARKADWSPLKDTCYQGLDAQTQFAPACKPGAKVAIMGDSMALAWHPFVDALYGDVALYSRGACPPQIGHRKYANERGDLCTRFIANAIRESRKADVVFIAAAWNMLEPSQLDATLTALDGRKVYIIAQSPTLPMDAPVCARFGRECSTPPPPPYVTNTLRVVAARHGATVIDPLPFLCAKACGAEKDGTVLYWDTHHVSATAARAFASQWRQASESAAE